jgi:hypothetical protein
MPVLRLPIQTIEAVLSGAPICKLPTGARESSAQLRLLAGDLRLWLQELRAKIREAEGDANLSSAGKAQRRIELCEAAHKRLAFYFEKPAPIPYLALSDRATESINADKALGLHHPMTPSEIASLERTRAAFHPYQRPDRAFGLAMADIKAGDPSLARAILRSPKALDPLAGPLVPDKPGDELPPEGERERIAIARDEFRDRLRQAVLEREHPERAAAVAETALHEAVVISLRYWAESALLAEYGGASGAHVAPLAEARKRISGDMPPLPDLTTAIHPTGELPVDRITRMRARSESA